MKKSFQLTSWVMALLLMFTMVPFGGVYAEGQDISHMLSDISVDLKIEGNSVIEDNDLVSGGNLSSNSAIELSVSWSLSEDNFYGNAEAGDYFEISLPYEFLNFTSIDESLDLVYNGETLGYWTVLENAPIHFVLSEEGAQKLSLEGTFKFYGRTKVYEDSITSSLVFNDVVIDIPVTPLQEGTPTEGFIADEWNLPALVEAPVKKFGSQPQAGTKNLWWSVKLNDDNLAKAAKNESFDTLTNAYFEDKLDGSQAIGAVYFSAHLNRPFSTGALSSEYACEINLNSYFPLIENTNGLSDEDFLESLRTLGRPGYGMSSAKDHLVVSFGDIPGNGIKYAENDDAFRATFPDWVSDAEREKLIEVLGDNGPANGAVLAYTIQIPTSTTSNQNVFNNTAIFAHSKDLSETTSTDVILKQIAGTITGLAPNSARLVKVDEETGAKIENTTFKLQKKDANGDFEDYGSEQVTDTNGAVEYKNMPVGTYRFVEVKAADGYDIDSVIYDIEQFAIIDGEQGILVNATNKKLEVTIPEVPSKAVKPYPLGWMRSTELSDESYLINVENGSWNYNSAFNNTPIKYFENLDVQNKANEKAGEGTEVTRPEDEQLVGISHIWDKGAYFDKYKIENGSSLYDWASWTHWGVSGAVEDKGEYSIRRFSAYFEMDADTIDATENAFIAPEDELGNMSYLFPVNDTVFVFVNGQLAYWGGTDVVEGNNQYRALNRTIFMNQEGIKVRNGVNGVLKDIYPHTDGWCIDLEANKDKVNIKSLLKPGFNRIDVFTDEYWEGGGMNKINLFVEK